MFLVTLAVNILRHPDANVTVNVEEDSFIHCKFNGTPSTPIWTMMLSSGRNKTYASVNLPPKHFYNGSGLVIINVDSEMNGTRYGCFLNYFQDGSVMTLHSKLGTLLVQNTTKPSVALNQVQVFSSAPAAIGALVALLAISLTINVILVIILVVFLKFSHCKTKVSPGYD